MTHEGLNLPYNIRTNNITGSNWIHTTAYSIINILVSEELGTNSYQFLMQK